jgi:hypothetical protein
MLGDATFGSGWNLHAYHAGGPASAESVLKAELIRLIHRVAMFAPRDA